jgi:hypothetical protein
LHYFFYNVLYLFRLRTISILFFFFFKFWLLHFKRSLFDLCGLGYFYFDFYYFILLNFFIRILQEPLHFILQFSLLLFGNFLLLDGAAEVFDFSLLINFKIRIAMFFVIFGINLC